MYKTKITVFKISGEFRQHILEKGTINKLVPEFRRNKFTFKYFFKVLFNVF